MDLEISVDASGAVFDGRAIEEMYRYTQQVEERIGEEGVTRIRAYLPTQYMYLGHHGGDPVHNPIPVNAGMLQAAIHSERQTPEQVIVTDTPVTYGDWIEGVSALNLVIWRGRLRRGLSGRFPGYHTFRIITQILDAEAGNIAEGELPPYLAMINM